MERMRPTGILADGKTLRARRKKSQIKSRHGEIWVAEREHHVYGDKRHDRWKSALRESPNGDLIGPWMREPGIYQDRLHPETLETSGGAINRFRIERVAVVHLDKVTGGREAQEKALEQK